MSEYPKKVEMKDVQSLMGKYIMMWRGEGEEAKKAVVKVLDAWEADGEVRIAYTVKTGPDKDKDFNARYDPSQTIMAYDEDSLSLAVLEV